MLSGATSDSSARSQVWCGWPDLQLHSLGKGATLDLSAQLWSMDGSARAMWPKNFRHVIINSVVLYHVLTWGFMLHDCFPPGRGAEYCDEYVCLSVCIFVCLYAGLSVHFHISEITRLNFTRFLLTSPATMAQFCSDGIVMCYILPVSWMTSCFHIIGSVACESNAAIIMML